MTMHSFDYRDGEMFCEDVPLRRIAADFGTPSYVYSRKRIERNYRKFDGAFASVAHQVCFAVKANSNLSLLKVLAGLGSGFDIVSSGELFRLQKIGVDPARVLFSGVGKTVDEIESAVSGDLLLLNLESTGELDIVAQVAQRLNRRPRIAFRINPDVDPRTHPYIATGLLKHKFGVQWQKAPELYAQAASLGCLDVAGISCHIGSQITDVEPFVAAFRRLRQLAADLRAQGMPIRYLDLGGGLGIRYDKEVPPQPDQYAEAILREAGAFECTLLFEPGRVIVGNSGILLSRVLNVKENEGKVFYVVDAAMNDLLRPSLYQAYHEILPVRQDDRRDVRADVVGPICETGDFLARDRALPALESGDLIAVLGAGAYGFVQSSNYNSRPRAAEILVDGQRATVIRKRETLEDLVRGEWPIPEGI